MDAELRQGREEETERRSKRGYGWRGKTTLRKEDILLPWTPEVRQERALSFPNEAPRRVCSSVRERERDVWRS